MKTNHYIVTEEQNNQRVDRLLTQLTDISRQKIQKWIKEGSVKVNGQTVKPSYKCIENDEITWQEVEETYDVRPEKIPLQIVYEDEDLLVVNKEKGMLTHPTETVYEGTLVNALLNHTTSLSTLSGENRPGIVHRLDKDTSGLLIIAKNDEIHNQLINQFKERTVKRIYEAIVHGVVPHDSGIIKAPIGRDPKKRKNMTVIETGKEAETHFTVIERFNDYTYVQCELKTGRTHQIRVHLQYIGHPLVGDLKYGYRRDKQFDGHYLYAKTLSFIHPKKGEKMIFSVESPTYFNKMLQRLQKMT